MLKFQISDPFWLWPKATLESYSVGCARRARMFFPKLCFVDPTASGLQPPALRAKPGLMKSPENGQIGVARNWKICCAFSTGQFVLGIPFL